MIISHKLLHDCFGFCNDPAIIVLIVMFLKFLKTHINRSEIEIS